MTRIESPLTTYRKLSPNRTRPRTGKIRRLTPHCVAGNLSIEATLGLSRFVNYDPVGGASCNYAIGSDGRIGLGVEETNRAWTTSSRANDMEAITFEIANNGGAPDWRMSDEAINSWLNLAIDICRYYGYSQVNYRAKPDGITSAQVESWIATWAKPTEMIISLHFWYANKGCPGPYFIRQLPWLVNELNNRLNGASPERFIGEGMPLETTEQKPSTGFEPYLIRITTSALNIRKGPGAPTYPVVTTLRNDKNLYTIVEEADGDGAKKWGRLKSGIGWISLDYTTKK